MKKRKKDFLDDCPGLWYGNNPTKWSNGSITGNVTVATEKIVQAVDFLRKKRARIIETVPGPYEPDKSVLIQFELAWSKFKNRIVDFVRQHPGCYIVDVAEHLGRNPTRGEALLSNLAFERLRKKGYKPIYTAIRYGWIAKVTPVKGHGEAWLLYIPGCPEHIHQVMKQVKKSCPITKPASA